MRMLVPASNSVGLPCGAWLMALLAALLTAACPPASSRADVLRILKNNQEAAQVRVDLIQQAQVAIDASYFGVNDDELAFAFLALLRDASRRGVKVRLLVDALNNRIPREMRSYLIREGVEIRDYHPVDCCRPLRLNRRLHDKLLIVDGCHLIVGSRNLDERNFGLAERNFVDRDAYLRGKVAAQARAYFNCLWASDHVRPTKTSEQPAISDYCPLKALRNEPTLAEVNPGAALDQALFSLAGGCFVHTDRCCDWADCQPELACVRFLSDDCGRKCQPNAISEEILELIANARDSIILESPYLVVSHDFDKALAQAQARGVHVVILTNSLSSTDQILVYAGYANQKKRLLARGIEFWEFAGPDHFHAKSALIDGCISIIGSYNFDPRSEYLNTETAVVTRDAWVADDLIDSMAENFANAWQIGPDGKPINSTDRHPGADKARVRELRGARIVASLIKRQL
jgi:cardiolipin synthase C